MNNKMKWPDLSDIGVYFGSYRDVESKGSGLSVVDMTDQHAAQIASLGFTPAKSQYGAGIYVKTGYSLSAAMLAEAFGSAQLKWMVGERRDIDQLFKEKVREKSTANVNAVFAQLRLLGMNHQNEMVFESVNGRFVRRVIDGKSATFYEPPEGMSSEHLRAFDRISLAQVALGFVRRITVRGQALRSEQIEELMDVSNQGKFSRRQYQEAIEAQLNVLFREQTELAVAQDEDAQGLRAFAVASDIYQRMPKLDHRTADSIDKQQVSTPIVMAALVQAVLASRETLPGSTVLDPTVGNGALVSLLNVNRQLEDRCQVFGLDIDPDRVYAAREFTDKVAVGDATETDYRGLFGQPEGFDYIIANMPFGKLDRPREVPLPTGSAATEMSISRLDHLLLLQSLHARKDGGRAIFITGADGVVGDGQIRGRSKHLLAYLYDHYLVDAVVDINGELFKKHGAAYPARVYVIGARRQGLIEERELPQQLPVLQTYEAMRDWAEQMILLRDQPKVESPDASWTVDAEHIFDDGNSLEEAVRTLEVDLPDLIHVTQSLAEGLHPTDERPFASEGMRKAILSQHGTLIESVAGIRNLLPQDDPRVATIDEAIDAAMQAQAQVLSSPVVQSGTELSAQGRRAKSSEEPSPERLIEAVADAVDSAGSPEAFRAAATVLFTGATEGEKAKLYEKLGLQRGASRTQFNNALDRYRESERAVVPQAAEGSAPAPSGHEPILHDASPVPQQGVELSETEAPAPAQAPIDTRTGNEYYQPYVAFSNVREPSTMIPANLSGPVYEALSRVKARHGDIDTYVAEQLQFDAMDLGKYFEPEQVDALALIFHAHDSDLGFLLGDLPGVGKGRVLAAVARRERLAGRIPMFVTITDNLFTDFLERDIVAIDSRHLFEKPLIVNDLAKTTDAEGNVVAKSMPRPEYRRYAEEGALPPGTDIVLLTYSQLAFTAQKHLTTRYMRELTARYPITLLLDESHKGAGASNTSENLDTMIWNSERAGGNVVYSSGTAIKGAKNLKLYRRILPEGVNTDELLAAVASDPLSLQEALNYEIAIQGCLIVRSLPDTAEKEFHLSERVERNREVSDAVADMLAGMAYLSGDVARIVRSLNKDFEKQLQKIPESEREGSRLGATSMSFGSRLHAISGQMLLALKAPDVVDLVVKALQENRKPIVALRRTGESQLGDYLVADSEPIETEGKRKKNAQASVTLDRPVTFKDYMRRMLERITDIQVTDRYGKVSTRKAVSEGIKNSVEHLEDMVNALPDDLPIAPIDYLRERLAQLGYSMAEISGRNLQSRTVEGGKVVIEPTAGKTDRTRVNRVVRQFNNGDADADVLVLTVSGSTGLSVQASPAVGKDLRARRMIKWERQNDITAERQIDGRHDRRGQVERPEYVVPLTGLPADDRLAMMFNNANRSLTSSTVANRDSRELIKDVPDLLNVVGDEVAAELLYERPELARKLDINLPEEGDGWAKPPLWYVKSLTGHMTLLRTDEQFALYADLQARFIERLDQLKAEGRNPLEVMCHEWKARVASREIFAGAVREADSGAVRSMFNSPVYLTHLEYEQEMKAIRSAEVDEKILSGNGQVHGAQAFTSILADLKARRHELLERVKGSKFPTVEEALAAKPKEDGGRNEAQKLAEKLEWMAVNLARLGKGSVFAELDLEGRRIPNVVISYSAPSRPEAYARLGDYTLHTMVPGSDEIRTRTLSSVFASESHIEPTAFMDHVAARRMLDEAKNGIVTRRARVLDGNLFEATSLNLREHVGRKVVYTDVSGTRQHGILVHAFVSSNDLLSLPERVRELELLAAAIDRREVTTSRGGEIDRDDKQAVLLSKHRDGHYLLKVPGTKIAGGQYFLDPVLSVIKEKEHLNKFGLEFQSRKGQMVADVAPAQLKGVLRYLVNDLNVDFFIKDREFLRELRNQLDKGREETVELAA